MRYNKSGDGVLAIINFTPCERQGFKVGVPYEGWFGELISSDDEKYGGSGNVMHRKVKSKKEKYDGRDYSLTVDLPPLSGIILEGKRIVRTRKKAESTEKKKGTEAKK